MLQFRHLFAGVAIGAAALAVGASAAEAQDAEFACTVTQNPSDAVALAWTDIGHGYNIRHLIDGTDRWLETVDGTTTSTTVPSAFGTYKVIGNDGTGRVETTCDGPAGQPGPPGPFECSAVVGEFSTVVNWTDLTTTTHVDYYVLRQALRGEEHLRRRANTNTLELGLSFGDFVVEARRSGNVIAETTCPGPPLPEFTCQVDIGPYGGGSISWTEVYPSPDGYRVWTVQDGARSRLIVNQPDYFGNFASVVPVGEFEAGYWYKGLRITTRCSGTTVEPFECTVTPLADGRTAVEWNQQHLLEYFVEHHIDDRETTVKTTFANQRRITGDYTFGTMMVRGDQNGTSISATCDGPSGQPEPFECHVSGGTLTWTDQGARAYGVRQQVSGADVFVTRTRDHSTPLANTYGNFTMGYDRYGERFATTCDGTPLDDFTCWVDGDQLMWGDQQAGIYHLRQIVDGNDVYIGNSAETVWSVDDPRGSFQVIYRRDGHTFGTECTA